MRKIAFIGVGNMANAIIGGLLRSGAVDCPHLILSDKLPEKCATYTDRGATLVATPAEAAKAADCVVLAVKPQNFPEVLAELSEVDGIEHRLIVTIAAGVTVATIKAALHGAPVVRVLPNTPMLIGMGVSVICTAPDVSPADFTFVTSMFEASGSVTIIDESAPPPPPTYSPSSIPFARAQRLRDWMVMPFPPPYAIWSSARPPFCGTAALLPPSRSPALPLRAAPPSVPWRCFRSGIWRVW